jgi:hypothetical protein
MPGVQKSTSVIVDLQAFFRESHFGLKEQLANNL